MKIISRGVVKNHESEIRLVIFENIFRAVANIYLRARSNCCKLEAAPAATIFEVGNHNYV